MQNANLFICHTKRRREYNSMSQRYFDAYLKRKGEKLEEELRSLNKAVPSEKDRDTNIKRVKQK
jgi:hypothetical protein